jgi:tetratricopeptide (TPR) repeat protein
MAKLARLPTIGRSEADAGVRHMPRLRTRYYAFLSYSHKDKELADWLHRELERFRVPHSLAGKLTANGVVPRRLSPVFRDEQDLSAGGDLAEEIKAALAASQFLIVLCSPTAAKSRWTNQEIESFKRTRPEGCVLAAVVAGEPFASDLPGREAEECFPPALRFKYDRRGHQTTKRAEPLAADFREHGEGRRLAFLKLVAGMLGVGLDDLVQRDTTRRQRRLAYLAAASLAGMAVTSTLAAAAFQARNAAREQRRQAEGLVEFMLGDLRAKLEPIGKLDVLDGVGSRVLDYYQKEDTSELSDAALVQRSRALNLMAEVAFQRGHLDEADGLYRQAMAGTAEAARRSPSDTARLFDHAQNVFWLGEIARARGRTDEALADYGEYKRLGDRLVAMEPDNLKWRMEAAYGAEDVAIALFNKRQFAEAAQQFENALAPMQKLASLDPGNLTYQKELGTVLAWIGDSQRALGHTGAAVAARTRQIALLEQGLAHAPGDVRFKTQLIIPHQALGILLAYGGQPKQGIEQLRLAVAQSDALVPLEPTNAVWKSYAAGAKLELARALLADGQIDEASRQTNDACALISGIRVQTISATRRAACLQLRARLALRSGAKTQALDFAKEALSAAQQARSEDPLRDRFTIAAIYRLIGDSESAVGSLNEASAAWRKAVAAIPQAPEIPTEMDEHARILERLGRTADARSIRERLSTIGYHSET